MLEVHPEFILDRFFSINLESNFLWPQEKKTNSQAKDFSRVFEFSRIVQSKVFLEPIRLCKHQIGRPFLRRSSFVYRGYRAAAHLYVVVSTESLVMVIEVVEVVVWWW